jgi:hypothetical protein
VATGKQRQNEKTMIPRDKAPMDPAFEDALQARSLERVVTTLKEGVSPLGLTKMGRSALSEAIAHDMPQVAALLAKLGANPLAEDESERRTPLGWAVYMRDEALLATLLQNCLPENLNEKALGKLNPLNLAVADDQPRFVEMILAATKSWVAEKEPDLFRTAVLRGRNECADLVGAWTIETAEPKGKAARAQRELWIKIAEAMVEDDEAGVYPRTRAALEAKALREALAEAKTNAGDPGAASPMAAAPGDDAAPGVARRL